MKDKVPVLDDGVALVMFEASTVELRVVVGTAP